MSRYYRNPGGGAGERRMAAANLTAFMKVQKDLLQAQVALSICKRAVDRGRENLSGNLGNTMRREIEMSIKVASLTTLYNSLHDAAWLEFMAA